MSDKPEVQESIDDAFESSWREYNANGNAGGWERVAFISGFGKGWKSAIAAHAPRRSEAPRPQPDWENLYNRIRLNVISWGGQAHGYLNSLDSKPAKEIAANLNDALHALIDLELGAGVPATPDEPAYPKPCGICDGVIQSASDLDWHGYGNCRDIPDVTVAALDDTDEATQDELKAAHSDDEQLLSMCLAAIVNPQAFDTQVVEDTLRKRLNRYSGEAPQPKGEPK